MNHNSTLKRLALAALLVSGASVGLCDAPDANAIVSAAGTAFAAVAGLMVTIGTFMVVYRLVRKIR